MTTTAVEQPSRTRVMHDNSPEGGGVAAAVAEAGRLQREQEDALRDDVASSWRSYAAIIIRVAQDRTRETDVADLGFAMADLGITEADVLGHQKIVKQARAQADLHGDLGPAATRLSEARKLYAAEGQAWKVRERELSRDKSSAMTHYERCQLAGYRLGELQKQAPFLFDECRPPGLLAIDD